MRNIKLTLEYDGTDFVGSQLQAKGRTVQGELENALARLTGTSPGQRCKVNFAGRTDSGVHANGQVANFLTESRLPLDAFRRGLNALLPSDVVVLLAEEVAESFHARFSATQRLYCYTVINRPSRPALERRFCHWVQTPLDLAAMQQAGQILIGQHDFASFAGAGWGVEPETVGQPSVVGLAGHSTTRNLTRLECSKQNDYIRFWLAANAFLPHMVRNIVGSLLLVGAGKISQLAFENILAARDRRKAGPTAPACGLSLVAVSY